MACGRRGHYLTMAFLSTQMRPSQDPSKVWLHPLLPAKPMSHSTKAGSKASPHNTHQYTFVLFMFLKSGVCSGLLFVF